MTVLVSKMNVLPTFFSFLLLLALFSDATSTGDKQASCSTYVNNTICNEESATTPSWCSYRNPYSTPRFLNQKDAATLENLSELASPVCEDDPGGGEPLCYMFSRFFATDFQKKILFVANVVTSDVDTNRLLPLDGLTYKEIPNLAPDVKLGSRYGDLSFTDALANDHQYLGVSVTVNPQKYYFKNLTPEQIISSFAYRYSGIYITEPDVNHHGSWVRYGYQSYFSDFVSVSSSAASEQTLIDTDEGGWWIYPKGEPTYVSLTKHSEFDIYRIKFVPGNYTNALDAVQIWEVDREPVDSSWAEKNCPETDPLKLKKLVMDQPACKNAEYPMLHGFLKTCPQKCMDLYQKYFHSRKCYKYVFDQVRLIWSPSNYAVRAFISSGHKCNAETFLNKKRTAKQLKLKFVQQSYGCNLDVCKVRAGSSPFPDDGVKYEESYQSCGKRTRTLVVLQTETSVSIMEYQPPNPIKQPIVVNKCHKDRTNSTSRCDPPKNQKDCPSPCINRAYITVDSVDESWVGLGNRLRKISIEDELLPSQKICSSCNSGSSSSSDDDIIDDPNCVHFPVKVITTPSIDTIAIFGSKLVDEDILSPPSTPSKHIPSPPDVQFLDLTQQLWMVVASTPKPSNKGLSINIYELKQFSNMSALTESTVTSCNPVGNIKYSKIIPLLSKPMTLNNFNGHSSKDTTEIKQMVYAYQTLPSKLQNILKNENCTCKVTDMECHIKEATKNVQMKSYGKNNRFDIGDLSQLQQVTKMEKFTHIIQASTSDRRVIVIYLNEILNDCKAQLIQAQGDGKNDISILLPTSDSPNSNNALLADIVNEIPLAGRAQHIDFTTNGMFSFITMTRLESEKESYSRAAEMCELLKKDPANPALLPYKTACSQIGPKKPRKLSILDFVQVTSFCPPGSYCESMLEYNITSMPDGYYSNYGFDQINCEKGSFCPQGIKQKCPIGFICPEKTMKMPKPCRIDSTKTTNCFNESLLSPQLCQKGQICYTPYMPGLPSPPGYKTSSINVSPRTLINCSIGEYCSLGRDMDDDTNCPSGTYCTNSSITIPINCTTPDSNCLKKNCKFNLTCPNQCQGMTSCPEGSYKQVNCSVGHYCPDPRSSGNPCPATSYCPIGTFSTPPPCPEGWYCPTPSIKHICPDHYFCPNGTITPQRCGVLDLCPEGAKEKRAGVWGLIFVALLPFVVWGISVCGYKERDRRRQFRNERRSLRLASSTSGQQPKLPSISTQGSDLEMSGTVNPSNHREFKQEEDEGQKNDSLNESLLHSHNKISRQPSNDSSYSDMEDGIDAEDIIDDVFAPRRFRVDFEFTNLGLNIKGSGKSVLDGVTGEIKSAHVTAVMGPSGAGKSTFVTTLAGKAYYGDSQGIIKINGKIRPLNDFKKVVGFVPQEDIMMRDLTVKENIWFSAQTRLPTNWSTKRKKRYRDATINVLGLHEIRHSMIGDENTRGISGGQRKRVNIALEMVADPLVLFLDEPTSGLDSTSSMEVCDALRKIADIGLTVVTVLHQPRYEIFCQFHDVLLLGKGGRAVYLGPSETALDYFENNGFECPKRVNPPDFMMDVIAGNVSDKFRNDHPNWHQNDLFQMWIDYQKNQNTNDGANDAQHNRSISSDSIYNRSLLDMASIGGLPPHDETLEKSVTERKQVSGLRLVWRFVKRSLKQQSRHMLDVAIDNGLLFFAALFMSYINMNIPWIDLPPSLPPQCYINVKSNYSELSVCGEYAEPLRLAGFGATNFILIRGQMTCMAVGLCTCASSIKVFGRERVVYFREAAGLEQPAHSISYFCGKDISVIPQMILGPLLYCAIFIAMSASLGDFYGLYLVLLGTTFVSYSIGYIVSIIAPSSLAQLVGVVVVFCMSAFDGASPTIPNLHKSPPPLSWGFEHLSYLTPALKAFYDNEAEMWINTAESAHIDMVSFAKTYFGYDRHQYNTSILILFSWGIFFRILGALLISCKDKNKKL
jgi:ABC-type multidrug transport system ATPase subunit